MPDDYRYIHFVEAERKPKTRVWQCRNNRSGDCLGTVAWYEPWRQYCFSPEPFEELVFNRGCLRDISHFLEQAMQLHQTEKEASCQTKRPSDF